MGENGTRRKRVWKRERERESERERERERERGKGREGGRESLIIFVCTNIKKKHVKCPISRFLKGFSISNNSSLTLIQNNKQFIQVLMIIY